MDPARATYAGAVMHVDYDFKGRVVDVEADKGYCWIDMQDVTDPSLPDEEWQVEIAKMPRVPKVGERVTFRMQGTFRFPDDPSPWWKRLLDYLAN